MFKDKVNYVETGSLKPEPKCRVQVSVYPTLVPNSHVLASVNGVFNAVFVRGDVVGDALFYGRGAGKDATASAVLSDIGDAVLDLKSDAKNRLPAFVPHECSGAVSPIEEVVSQYFVRLNVTDKPGVLAMIATMFGEAKIGISSVIQPEGHQGKIVPLIFMLHTATNGAAAFPAEYRGDAFACEHGSWNRTLRTGYKVVRARLDHGVPTGEYEDFMTGFVVDNQSVWGRPVGVTVMHDGALLVSEDGNGTLWRIAYSGH